MEITLKDIEKCTGGTLFGTDKTVYSLTTDSRNVKNGSMFAIIKGARVDAMDFAAALDAEFDTSFLSDRPVENCKSPYVLVDDVIKAIGDIAAVYLERMPAKHVCVTGSVGKTTTKNYIVSALSECLDVHYAKGNKNNELGLPLTALEMPENCQAAVFEMGMRGSGQIEYLCNIAKPDVAVITNIGICHIELLGSKENIFLAKKEIVDCLADDGTAVINADDEMLCNLKTDKKVIRYGIKNENCDIRAINVEGNKFGLVYKNKCYNVTLSALGIHNVYNALAAVGVGIALGLDIEKLICGAQSFAGDGSRQNIYEFEGVRIFDDTYNASPDSMRASMNVMKGFEGRKILVLADMLELGDYSEAAHRDLAKSIADIDADVCILIGEQMVYLADELSGRENVYSFTSNEQALGLIRKIVKKGDNILFKGSNSMNLAGLVKDFKGE